ncbi:spidroin-2-like [Ochotona princeps]|uniref:spidroin-2-like n=1 Tax=Ochotona princeps TaxID=9978 RepID=UPI002714867A|nr:spidroin-2-like [Ochotona princeps]
MVNGGFERVKNLLEGTQLDVIAGVWIIFHENPLFSCMVLDMTVVYKSSRVAVKDRHQRDNTSPLSVGVYASAEVEGSGSQSCHSPRAGKAESAADVGNGRARGAQAPGLLGGSGPGVDPRAACARGGPGAGLLALPLRKRGARPRGPGAEATGQARRGPARRGWVGWAEVGASIPARGATRISFPFTPRPPGADARSQGARILQTGPGRREAAGEGKATRFAEAPRGPQEATCLSPAAAGSKEGRPVWRFLRAPGCRASHAAALSPPGASPPRPRRAGTSEPRPPGASRPRSERPSGSLTRRQRQQKTREGGGGAPGAALPAAAAAAGSRRRRLRRRCAPQRSTAQRPRGSWRPRLCRPPPPFPGPLPAGPPAPGRRREGATASPCLRRVGDEESSPSSVPSRRVTPPPLSRRCSTCPYRVRHSDLAAGASCGGQRLRAAPSVVPSVWFWLPRYAVATV